MKRASGIPLIAVAVLVWLASCGGESAPPPAPKPTPPPSLTLAVVTGPCSGFDRDYEPFYRELRGGAEQAVEQLKAAIADIHLIWLEPEDAAEQAEMIRSLAGRSVQGAVVMVDDPALAGPAINEASSAGVDVVTFLSDAPGSSRLAYFGYNHEQCGTALVRTLKTLREDAVRFAVLAPKGDDPVMRQRLGGVRREMETRGGLMSMLGVVEFGGDDAPVWDAIRNYQQEHPECNAWIWLSPAPLCMGDPPLDALNGLTVVTMGNLPEWNDWILDGRIAALVGKPPAEWGAEAVSVLADRLTTDKVFRDTNWERPRIVTQKNSRSETR
ncbi:MAG: substrate-binding domain-containing protein [bacterium]|nr:substrate-binding domain-containing protein [bacterium]